MKAIKLRHNKNLRDIGGKYKDVNIKYGMFLRGRALLNVTPKQNKLLRDKYNVHTVIDLRDVAEQAEAPDLELEGIKKISMPVFADEKVGISHEDRKNPDKIKLLQKLPPMTQLYYEMFHDTCLENLAKIIKYMITAKDEEYGFYFHCSEGKDRTGIVSAILLKMLGVSKEEIIEEYLYTNKVAKHRARRYYILARYGRFDIDLAKKLHGMFSARPEYIEVLFTTIQYEYGDDMTFFKKGLKLTEKEIEAFREKMIIKDN